MEGIAIAGLSEIFLLFSFALLQAKSVGGHSTQQLNREQMVYHRDVWPIASVQLPHNTLNNGLQNNRLVYSLKSLCAGLRV